MANLSAVSSAIGTQRQFTAQPQDLYQMRLIRGNYDAGISQRSDLDAQALVGALKDFGGAIWSEHISEDKRKREQATLVTADKMLAGKTKEDLKTFDRINALQHASEGTGFDLTDNKYAMAALDHDIGMTLGDIAKNEWYSESQTLHPKDVPSALKSFNEKMDDYYSEFADSASNKVAFQTGFTKGKYDAAQKVAKEAYNQINDAARYKGQQTVRVSLNNLAFNILDGKMPPEEIKGTFETALRKLQGYCKDPKEAVAIVSEFLDNVSENEITNENIKIFKEAKLWGDDTVGSLIPMYNYRKKMAKNFTRRQAKQLFEQCVRSDGTFDYDKYHKLKSQIPQGMLGRKVPRRDIPLSDADNPDMNIDPKLKEIIPLMGGILSNLGYGDNMLITSGYRDEERNRRAGGVANSRHLSGNALDIYIGKLDKEEADQVLATFRPYFNHVEYHDAGNGLHLHVQDYNGGLDGAGEDENEVTGSAYAPERSEELDRIVYNLAGDKQRQLEAEYRQVHKEAVSAAYNASGMNEAFEAIDNHKGLKNKDKAALKRDIASFYKAQDAVNNGTAKKDIAAMVSYMHPMSGTNIWKDERTIAELNKKNFLSSAEKDKKTEAEIRFNWYINKVAEQNPNMSRDLAKVAHYGYNYANTDGEEDIKSPVDYDFNFANTDGGEKDDEVTTTNTSTNTKPDPKPVATATKSAAPTENRQAPKMTDEERRKIESLKQSLNKRVFDNAAIKKATIMEVAKELELKPELVEYYILKGSEK